MPGVALSGRWVRTAAIVFFKQTSLARMQPTLQRVFILPANNQLVVDCPNPIDRPQGFLSHLFFEETSHSSPEDYIPIVGPEKNLPLMEVRMANDYLTGKICQFCRV